MLTLALATRNRHKADEIRAILGEQFRYLTLRDFPDAPTVMENAETFAGNATKKAAQLARWLAQVQGPRLKESGSELFVLADDSGLEVDALGGAPGVRSARFAASGPASGAVCGAERCSVSGFAYELVADMPATSRRSQEATANAPDTANNAKLLLLLKAVPGEKRTARFRCVLALTPVLAPQPENASPVCYANECELLTELFEGVCEGRIGFEPRGQGGFGYDPLFIPAGYDRTFAELGEELKNGFSHRAKALSALKSRLESQGFGVFD